MDFGLRQELQQKLVMTPQLRQAIAILQLSAIELNEMLEKEMLENPVLEIDENNADTVADDGENVEAAPDSEADIYTDWAEYFDSPAEREHTPAERPERATFEAFIAKTVSLQEHLLLQLNLTIVEPDLYAVGEFLIGSIDDNGYLQIKIEEVAKALNVESVAVERVLHIIQTFEPHGVGARSLAECLMIQARQREIGDLAVLTVINEHLDAIADGKIKQVADAMSCSLQDIQRAVDVIRTLNPKPGCAFGGGQSLYIIPDMTVQKVGEKYVILLNDTDTPRLTVSPYYRNVAGGADIDARKYVEGRIQAAVWLIKSIEQRRRTLYNIMEAIIALQDGFFARGPRYLEPMTMKRVAEQAGVHESTVSRATANKYVDTPYGLFSMRAFFSAAVQGAAGADVSASCIKREIKELITHEDTAKPYSDQDISDIFSRRGITLSRRTVAKYRDEMKIASSTKRKRY